MYYVTKTVTISAAHMLDLDYKSACSGLHGHNWKISVTVGSDKLDSNGMVVDFSHIKNVIMKLDHRNLNDFMVQPTSEKLANFLLQELTDKLGRNMDYTFISEITVEESDGNVCRLIRDN